MGKTHREKLSDRGALPYDEWAEIVGFEIYKDNRLYRSIDSELIAFTHLNSWEAYEGSDYHGTYFKGIYKTTKGNFFYYEYENGRKRLWESGKDFPFYALERMRVFLKPWQGYAQVEEM